MYTDLLKEIRRGIICGTCELEFKSLPETSALSIEKDIEIYVLNWDDRHLCNTQFV